jgi:adenine-specific DNA-methyltransferase
MTEILEPEKLELTTVDPTAEKQADLLRLFPEARTEGGKIDFDRLRLALGETVDVGKERYGMNWPGKSDCFKTIQRPSLGTLLPVRDESVNFDETKNLIIEGDNLEVLKLMQKSYQSKVKAIYIDPPYNTGKDFIYPDNYSESLQTYLEYTGQADSEGRKFSNNVETDGRFHSKWMNMMYPRLYLSKNLLREDGAIFISIDEHEVENLMRICDEVFGEDCRAGLIAVVNNLKGRNDRKHFATAHEYLLVYGKDEFIASGLPLTDEQRADFKYMDDENEPYALRDLRKRGAGDRREDRPNMFFPVYFNEQSGVCALERQSEDDIEILPFRGDGTEGRWRWGTEKTRDNLNILHPRMSERSGKWGIEYRIYLNTPKDEDDDELSVEERSSKAKSFWTGPEYSTDVAKRSFKSLMGDCEYEFPKPVGLIRDCLFAGGVGINDIVLDFFAGSGTTGQVALETEAAKRPQFILVQLPEPTGRSDFKTISDITKERVRRVIQRDEEGRKEKLPLSAEAKEGFRVLKLATSNFAVWNASTDTTPPELLEQQLELHINHVLSERTSEDLLYEILLKSGFPLTAPVQSITVEGLPVYSVANGAMLICLEKALTHEVIKGMAELKPERVVCLDEGFAGNDQLKTNAVLIMKSKGVTKFQTV